MPYLRSTIKQISDYRKDNPPVCETELNFDWSDAHFCCWNCGDDRSRTNRQPALERCHIIPRALGGKDVPINYVLLCKDCHAEAPNVNDPKFMWEWILSNKVKFNFTNLYKFNKGNELLQQRKGKDFFKDVLPNLNMTAEQVIEHFKKYCNSHGTKYNKETYYAFFVMLNEKTTKKKVKVGKNQSQAIIYSILSSISEIERLKLKEIQGIGIAIAKEKGLYKGRKKGTTMSKEKFLQKYSHVIDELKLDNTLTVRYLAKKFNHSTGTIQQIKNKLAS